MFLVIIVDLTISGHFLNTFGTHGIVSEHYRDPTCEKSSRTNVFRIGCWYKRIPLSQTMFLVTAVDLRISEHFRSTFGAHGIVSEQ